MSRTCGVQDCDRPAVCRGWCRTHYQRWRVHGDVLEGEPVRACRGPTCSVNGCRRRHLARGYCKAHVDRIRRDGDPTVGGPIERRRPQGLSVEGVFRWHMPGEPPPPGELWLWTGRRTATGYGDFTLRGRAYLAHRVSYELFIGPIPDGLHVRHRNDTPPDVNPYNLELGTPRDNSNDKVQRGREARGTQLPHAKLTEETVRQAREIHAGGKHSARSLARMFGVSADTMNKAVTGQTWRHVS